MLLVIINVYLLHIMPAFAHIQILSRTRPARAARLLRTTSLVCARSKQRRRRPSSRKRSSLCFFCDGGVHTLARRRFSSRTARLKRAPAAAAAAGRRLSLLFALLACHRLPCGRLRHHRHRIASSINMFLLTRFYVRIFLIKSAARKI